jgi:ribosomal protein S8
VAKNQSCWNSASNLKKTKILFDQGYILSYKFEDNAVQGSIKIALKYDKDTKESVIKISKELVNQVYVNIQVLQFQESLTIGIAIVHIERFDDRKQNN